MIRTIITFLVITIASTTLATDQVWDSVMIDGKRNWLLEPPLAAYWSKPQYPNFDVESTANRSGYNCAWEIRDSALYLIDFSAKINRKPVTHADVFPDQEWPLRATWYTGMATVVEEAFPLGRKPHTANARLYLIEKGKVRNHCNIERMRFGEPLGPQKFTLKREEGHIVVKNPLLWDAERIPDLSSDDIIIGVVNPNGFSINFTDESEELASAILAADSGNEIVLLLKTPTRSDEIRSVKIKRFDARQRREMVERIRMR